MLARAVAKRADGPLLQRYALRQATVVMGAQFHAQVKQASGSFRAHGSVVTAAGPADTQLRVSEDGKMAVEATDLSVRQPKVFYATQAVMSAANTALKRHHSQYLLYVDQQNAITVADSDGTAVRLHRILPKRGIAFYKSHTAATKGMGVTVKQVCDEVASEIVGRNVTLLLPTLDKALGMNAGLVAHEYKVARWFVDRIRTGEDHANAHINDEVITAPLTREQVTSDYMQVLRTAPATAALIAHELGINAFADPRVGQSFGSISLGNPDDHGIADYGAPAPHPRRKPLTADVTRASGHRRDIWGTHYGAVIAESAGNKVTLENYGRKGEDPTNVSSDPIYYFQMYGPMGRPSQTWHGQWSAAANPVINPITMVYG